MKPIIIFVSLFLLCSVFTYADSTYINPPWEEAHEYNINKANELIHFTENYANITDPNFEKERPEPIKFFDVQLFGPSPSVDNRISTNHLPVFIWGWGEEHLDTLEYSWKSSNCERCCDNSVKYSFDELPGVYIRKAEATFTFGNITKTKDLSNLIYGYSYPVSWIEGSEEENPFEMPFNYEELDIDPIKIGNETKVPDLNVSLYVVAHFPYFRRRTSESLMCNDEGVCFCRSYTYYDSLNITRERTINKTYKIENHNVSNFLLTPPLKEQTIDGSKIELLFFSNREPYKIILNKNNKTFNSIYKYTFSIYEDIYGIKYVNSTQTEHKGSLTNDTDINQTINLYSNISHNYSNRYIDPYQLIEDINETYERSDHINSTFKNTTGKHNFEIIYYDFFHDKYPVNFILFTRIPTYLNYSIIYSSNESEEGISFRLLTEKNDPLMGRTVFLETNEKLSSITTDIGGYGVFPIENKQNIRLFFAGNEEYRPCEAYINLKEPEFFPLEVFTPLFVFIVLFAGISYKVSGNIFPVSILISIWRKFKK